MFHPEFLQSTSVATELTNRLPTFNELVYWYGPYLGLVIILVSAIGLLQYIWYQIIIRKLEREIDRLVKRDILLTEMAYSLLFKQNP